MIIKECNQLIRWKHMYMKLVSEKDLVSEKEEIKRNNIIKQCKNN